MNFLGFIKNGNKGTYGLNMPAFYPASRVSYGGGTVEDALGGNKFVLYENVTVTFAAGSQYAVVNISDVSADLANAKAVFVFNSSDAAAMVAGINTAKTAIQLTAFNSNPYDRTLSICFLAIY